MWLQISTKVKRLALNAGLVSPSGNVPSWKPLQLLYHTNVVWKAGQLCLLEDSMSLDKI